MKTAYSLSNRITALLLSIILVIGMLPTSVFATEVTGAAMIGETVYDSLAAALAAVPTGENQIAPAEATTVTLLQDTAYAFDVGTSTGATTMNLKLDLNGKTLTLAPSVGSVGTKSNGIRVLAYSKLEIANGTIKCSDETADNVKVGIANYGELVLDDVALKAGALTRYTVNNRGALVLKGSTSVDNGTICAVTNDPYDLYYTGNVNASVTCASSGVSVGSMMVERYERDSANEGVVELNISGGYFGKIVEDGNSAVGTAYNVTGGTIGVSTTEELQLALSMIKAGSAYQCPEKAVTIQLQNDISGSFNVGTANGKAPKNICLDLNGNTLTLKPGIGSVGTSTNGIRVMAYSKLKIANGTVKCSDEAEDNIKVGIANYSDLILSDVAVKSGAQTMYTVNNRGSLTLVGETSVENGKVAQTDYADSADYVAITNDPYNLYYQTPINAEINCDDSDVEVGNIQLETYGSKGDIELNIADGSFGGVYQPAAEGTVSVDGAITGGSFDTDVSDYCDSNYTTVLEDGKYVAQYDKGEQTDFAFITSDAVEITYNDNGNKYTNAVQNAKGTVTYAIVSEKNADGEEDDVAKINETTGEVTVHKAGTVRIKATAAGTEQYNAAEIFYTLTIQRAAQTGFAFENPNPVDQWTGTVFPNTASGGQGNGAVTYAITSEKDSAGEDADIADIDTETGKLTFKGVGTVTVKATKAADEKYAEVTASYTVKTYKTPQELLYFTFENSNSPIEVGFATGSFTNVAIGGSGTGAVTYAIVGDENIATVNETTGEVTFHKAGEVTVMATKAADKDYFETTATYILKIQTSEQEALTFKEAVPGTITYSPNAQTVLPAVEGGSGNGEIKYSITEGVEFAEIDETTGVITTLKAGGIIKVQVDKLGDGNYVAATPLTCQIEVKHAAQTGFAFAEKEPEAVTFNDNDNKFSNKASGGESTGDITYTTDATDVAEINKTTGELTIKKAGTVTVTATKAGDDKYLNTTAQYTLTVNKDTPEFKVQDVPLIYGVTEYQINVETVLGGEGKYLYTIDGENKIGAAVDENGKVTFANSEDKVGTITILVAKAADEQYEAGAAKSFKLTVSYHETDLRPAINGPKKAEDNPWFVGNVTLAAPEDYQIAYSNDLTGVVWADQVTVDTEGDHPVDVYLKKGNEITGAVRFDNIKIDTAAPTVNITYSEPSITEKLLENITFGIYDADETVTVTLTATDVTSGIEKITYSIGGDDVTLNADALTEGENGTVSHQFSIAQQLRNQVTMTATDKAGWTTEGTSEHTLVVDTVSPELKVSYVFAGSQRMGETIYTNNNVTVKFEIKEANFDLNGNYGPVLKDGDLPIALTWNYVAETGCWTAELPLSTERAYDLNMTYADRSGNAMVQADKTVQYAQKLVIDKTIPVISSSYAGTAVKDNIFGSDCEAEFKITETNFDANNVVLTVTAEDITGAVVDISDKAYSEYARDPSNWKYKDTTGAYTTDASKAANADEHYLVLPEVDIEANYDVKLDYTDLAKNAATTFTDKLVVDKTAANNLTISYSESIADKVLEGVTFGFYQAKVQVAVTAKDQTAGVDYFLITYNSVDGANNSNKATCTEKLTAQPNGNDKTLFTATHTIDAGARGTVSVVAVDRAQKRAEKAEGYVVVTDMVKPRLERAYTFTDDQVNFQDGIYYTKGDTKVKFTVTEANFDLSLKTAEDETAAPAPVLTVNGVAQTVEWTQIEDTDKWEAILPLTGNGDYVVELTYTDRSTNAMESFREEIHIDNAKPVFEVTYDNNSPLNTNHYKADRTATVKVTEHNFEPKEVELTVEAMDVTGKTVDISPKAYSAYAKEPSNWKYKNAEGEYVSYAAQAANADEHYLVLPVFDIEAAYAVKLDYADLAENAATTFTDRFVVDKAVPANIQIAYSNYINTWEQVLNAITFGYYSYEEQMVVTLTADDITSGVDYFDWTYTKEAGSSDKNTGDHGARIEAKDISYSDKGLTATATFTVGAQARGYISASVTDKAGNTSGKADDTRINIVDTVDPDRTVSYKPERILDAETMQDVASFDENSNVILYYKNSAVVTFKITEANFYKEDVVIKVNGEPVVPTDWTQSGDDWTGTITISGDGDYVVELTYTDRSSNEMVSYTSQKIAIDAGAPTIAVDYDNDASLNTNYYKANRTATVLITEHNFRANDVVLTVEAKDITGKDVDISTKGYTAYAKQPANWKYRDAQGEYTDDASKAVNADEHYLVLPVFDIDAAYDLKVEYTDLKDNVANAYTNSFVVDKTPADNVTISYSKSTLDKVLEGITFGFYQAQVEVTVTANDQTAGVDYFLITYSQVDGDNNSNKATYTEKLAAQPNGTLFTATHPIKAEARGTVSVQVLDKAGNESGKAEDYVVVADTIAPGLEREYTFTGNQYRHYQDIYYTQGQTKVKFTVTEANFDLSLKSNAAPVLTVNGETKALTWTQITDTDQWEAEHTLTGNGDYTVELTYTDCSTNVMETFREVVHIDNAKPVFEVTYDNNSALNTNHYKADRTATVKVTEHNFEPKEVVLTVGAKDVTGAAVDISSKAYTDYAKNPDNWKYKDAQGAYTADASKAVNADEHYLVLPVFDIEAAYAVKLDYTDLAENVAKTYTADFVVDKTAAGNVTISYSKSIVDKVLESVTFGFYQANVVLTVTADDQTAGVDYFEITYTQVDGANNSNKATYTTEKLAPVQDGTRFTATHTIDAQARGTVSVSLADKAGNESGKAEGYVVVADTIAPGLEREYTFTGNQYRHYQDIYYTQGQTKVKFTVTEANFDLSLKSNAAPVLTVNGETKALTWTQITDTDQWEAEHTLTGNGDYTVELTYTDCSTNVMETFREVVHIDNAKPVFDVTYDNNSALNTNHYKADRTATVKVTEHNFEPKEVELTVEAKDVTGKAVDISSKAYSAYAKEPANWKYKDAQGAYTADASKAVNADEHYLVLPVFDIEAGYDVKLDYTDLAENAATTYIADFVVDKTVPASIQIAYSNHINVWDQVLNTVTFGYYSYKEQVVVTLTADDITSGVDYFTWTYTQENGTSTTNKTTDTQVIATDAITYSADGKSATASFVIDAQARGYISVDVTDRAGNTSGKSDDKRINVVDNVDPERTVSYTPERILDAETMLDVTEFTEDDDVILYYKNSAVVTFKITEANFYKEDVVIKVNGEPVAPTDWTQNGDEWTGTITISGDGDYVVELTYTDRSTNKMVDYTSQKIAIDATIPTVQVVYDNNEALNTNNYKENRTATITITEHNFRADDVAATVTAVDVQGNKVDVTDYAAYLANRGSWKTTGDTHVATITYSADARYTFDIAYADIIGNAAEDYAEEAFVVDHNAPTGLNISYSTPVAEKVIEALTFGFYQADVVVTLTADDITSGVDYFDWTYTKEAGSSDKNTGDHGARIEATDISYSDKGLTATASFKISANARGYISATVTDKAGNAASKSDDKRINVVDNLAPSITVEYTADSPDTLVQFVDQDMVTVDSFEKAANAYYGGNVTAKIVIDEANFFEGVQANDGVIYNVGIKLTKTDDNGNVTVYEYLPEGAVQKYSGATRVDMKWTTEDDVHTYTIPYTDNADYVLEIDYTDLSVNEAGISANDGVTATKAYKSKVITVDKVAPVVDVKYSNENIIHTIDGRDYFDAVQSATITVEEHNFRADDFLATVTAKNVIGEDVTVEAFKDTLSDDSKWSRNGNTHTITINYTVDANYTFDYEYKDLACNAADAYEEDLFTVDVTSPTNLTVTYSEPVWKEILDAVTFGVFYYDAEMTVTITAEDETSGIYYFVYSYLKGLDVSQVNAELLNAKIEDANNRITFDGKKATTSFTIPQEVLQATNQFNGTIEFAAFDRSENTTGLKDAQQLIVDNIAPTATISYNNPVQTANNIAYYAGNIHATIVVNEANFYSQDAVVTVTRNGANYPVNVTWVDDSVDVHTGTFTLTEDGDYIVTVKYQDRSQNQPIEYTSNRLTLDTKLPTITATNIVNNSANKDAVYGFTITASDINLDAATFKPVLTATVRKADGSYETKTVSLGNMKTVEAGKTYSFTVDNLEEDAVYSLVCTVKDMSGNQYGKIALSDNVFYDEVRFSINRDGSTFAVDKNTDALVNQYYVYSVDADVVLEEVNVDPIENYVVKLNGETLTEGTDYTTTLSDKAGEWSKRTYIIFKENFEAEGEYNIVVESEDKAGTTAYSDVKNLNVSFVVDQTAPVLTISGLESGGRYQVQEQTVTVIPTDDGGRLYSMKVIVLDSDGQPLTDAAGQDISVRFDLSGEDFLNYLTENGGIVTFTIPEGLENQVQVICNDCAVDAEGKTNEFNETYTRVTVSQSQWIIFYANKPLFYGTIAGILILIAGIVALIIFNKKRKAVKA